MIRRALNDYVLLTPVIESSETLIELPDSCLVLGGYRVEHISHEASQASRIVTQDLVHIRDGAERSYVANDGKEFTAVSYKDIICTITEESDD